MDYYTVARKKPSLTQGTQPFQHKTENVKHQKPKENSLYIAEIRTKTFTTSLLQVQWLKEMHLQDTLNNKASPWIHEQEGIKDKCSRSSNAICGSLPLNKKLITNNLWLTAAISLCLTLTESNLINLYWSASGPFSSLFWTSIAYQHNALSLLQPNPSTLFCNAEC